MSSTPFGDHLKREREMRGVTLEEISAATRIGTRFLVALENEDWDRLPGGVFNRGFIRSVARFLGLDEDSLIAEYELETKEKAQAGAAGHPPSRGTRNWRPAAVAVAILAVAVAAGWFAYHHYRLQIWQYLHKTRHDSAAIVTPAPSSPAPSTRQSPASSDAADALMLEIDAGKSADLKVVADGATVFDGHVNPDDVKFFDAQDGFEITSSDASAVALKLDGQPVASMGAPGQPGSVTLARKDLTPDAGGAH
ncbi:MAG: RodZ domain-containing protein [Candidatus Acidiferrales bacterium]